MGLYRVRLRGRMVVDVEAGSERRVRQILDLPLTYPVEDRRSVGSLMARGTRRERAERERRRQSREGAARFTEGKDGRRWTKATVKRWR